LILTAAGDRIEFERLTPDQPTTGAPPIVMLHEGLGSVSMWRDFPRQLSDATECDVIVYSRIGYGRSDPIRAPRAVRFMHDEALVRLPALLDALDMRAPILLGHSDGASIALIHAGSRLREVAAVIAMAPHVMVEDISIASIGKAKIAYETTDLRARLARHHDDVDSAFRGWNDVWLDPQFRVWNIEEYLPAIRCPVLAIQGEDDEYGTMEQVERIGMQVAGATLLKLARCGHSPHRDQPEVVLDAVGAFVARLRGVRQP
jgi:pimeloyl-ACP methyl ester carboxylesterase